MTRYDDCISLLSVVADALGDYRSEMVFVGGAIVGLLITARSLQDIRPTDDVDVIVETASYAKYNTLLTDLRQLGFVHDMNGPLCRFTINGVTVDVMPTEENILGFKNRWYPLAVKTAQLYTLPNGLKIRLINAPLFVCTKLEAFRDRGNNDFLMSSDIEDIVAIINGRRELIGEAWGMPRHVREYLRESCHQLLQNDEFLSTLAGLLPLGAANREPIVRFRMEQLARISTVDDFSGQVMVNYATDPLSIFVIGMDGTEQKVATRNFENRDDFFSCLKALGIAADPKRIGPDGINELYVLKNLPLEVLSQWGLLNPLD